MIKISPSILASNFGNLTSEINAMLTAGADMIHLDIMDGHFVPNISFGAPIIASIRKSTTAFFDTHLMISSPLDYIDDFVKAGSNRITFHLESNNEPYAVINAIKSLGVEVGIALKPATPISSLLPFLKALDQVLIMTVEPGFGGQSFMQNMEGKILELAKIKKEQNLSLDIQVDGGIDDSTATTVCALGANVLVAGSALFSQPDYIHAIKVLRESGLKGQANPLF